MNADSQEHFELRRLILESQSRELTDAERKQLNDLVLAPGGAAEAAGLFDLFSALEEVIPATKLRASQLVASLANPSSATSATTALSGKAETRDGLAKSTLRTQRTVQDWRGVSLWVLATTAAILVLSHLSIGVLSWSLAQRDSGSLSASGASPGSPAGESVVGDSSVPGSSVQPQLSDRRSPAKSYLVSATACMWIQSSQPKPKVGQTLQSGQKLELVEGIAELASGRNGNDRVRIEGPAVASLRPDGQISLRSGALTAQVADNSREALVIDTPMGPVKASSGAAIGIVASPDLMEVHAFRGRVAVSHGDTVTQRSSIEIAAGEAVRLTVDAEGEMDVVYDDASASVFSSVRSMRFDPLSIDSSYSNLVLASDPAIYWRFEELAEGSPKRIANQGSLGDFDAIVQGDVRWQQYASNRVAEFGASDETSAIVSAKKWPAKELDDYTIELWMKPSCYHHGEVLCLTSENSERNNGYDHGLLLEVGARHWSSLRHLNPNRVRCVHRNPLSNDVKAGTTLLSRDRYKVRSWQHWVMRKSGETINLIVDGELADADRDSRGLPPNMNIVIGQLYPDLQQRPFIGQIDEVAIYERALSDQELKQHYRAAMTTLEIKRAEQSEATAKLLKTTPALEAFSADL
ncbi:Concanavalin A-like lectin/glucanases superfamily protein [Neorhodopirellula lusitana]|uniref:Concanavalin A-like lectin/glucanases superfamily protein n=1 Tax=Neorhodopirellula lusitana TaxID=445327 RepID=A0ABY1QDF9_9BACT|nr:LamG domain-containing protein [Neorhodopirellula lusitana]SMP64329.1 Concanavalin A-like lectin/glucanases superfamily protein [Neorhodopirellula lusitana]